MAKRYPQSGLKPGVIAGGVCLDYPLEPGEYGDPPIMVDKSRQCEECGRVHDFEKCPKCGSWIEIGFGLMGGGFGEYKFCTSKSCDWFWKCVLPDDEA